MSLFLTARISPIAAACLFGLTAFRPQSLAGDQPRKAPAKVGLVHLQAENMPLGQALKQVSEQTGVRVADRRSSSNAQPVLKLDLQRVAFWEAIDAIARQAKSHVSVYEKDNVIALRDGLEPGVPLRYSGRFRVAVKKIDAAQNFETQTRSCVIRLELAWEPTVQPLFVDNRPGDIKIFDDKGAVIGRSDSSGRDPLAGRNAVEIPVRFPAPPRSMDRLHRVQGELQVVGSEQMLTFSFDHLDPAQPPPAQTESGVTAAIHEFQESAERWKISLLLKHPSGEPQFESFESWLSTTQAALVKRDAEQRLAPIGYEMSEQAEHQVLLTYYFSGAKGGAPGRPQDWKFVCRTPGPIGTMAVSFGFKDLPLP